jgi:hypothetical protein
MPEQNERVTVGFEELALSNSMTLAAVVELLEEKGVLSQREVLKRVKRLQDEVAKKRRVQ